MSEKLIEITEDGDELPVEGILTGRGVLFGQSGSGKSNTASVVVEELLERGHAVLIVDPDGEYYGLKEEYEVLHATGDDEGDITVGPEHAERLAEIALEGNIPVILDVSAYLDPEDADELVGKVARALFAKEKKLRKPFLFVVEEAHEYVPQSGGGGIAVDHITRVAKRGRKHGLGFLGISQRPANVDKDVVTQANWLVWHRLKFRNDTRVVSELYGSDVAEDVEKLSDGEAFVDSKWSDEIKKLQWRRKRTFDAGSTPGLDDTERPELRSIDDDVLEELKEAGDSIRSHEDRIEQLEERLVEREERVEALEAEIEQLEDRNAWEEKMAERAFEGLGGSLDISLEDGSIRAEVLEIVEERDELEQETDRLEERLVEREERVEALEAEVEQLEEYRDRVESEGELHQLRDDLRDLVLDRYPGLFALEGDERVNELREKLRDQQERIEELKERRPETVDLEADLLANEVVRGHIDGVAADCQYSDHHVWDVVLVLSGLAEGESASTNEVSKHVSVADKTTNGILNDLAGSGIAEKVESGRTVEYALDREALQERIKIEDQRAEIQEKREEFLDRGDGVETDGGVV